VPEVVSDVRIAVVGAASGNVTYLPAKCPSSVVLPGLGGLRCSFSAPWSGDKAGTVQAQAKSLASATWDVTSGTPLPFNFAAASEPVDLGKCVTVDREYVGQSALNRTAQPIASLVEGVDALLGALGVNLTRYGLAKPSVGELLGVAEEVLNGAKAPATKPAEPAAKADKPAAKADKGKKAAKDAPATTAAAGAAPAAPLPAKDAPAAKELPKPEAAKPEAAKPEAAKPEAAKPEAVKPEAAKPEAAKPEAAKPEAAKPEAAKPEAAKPEAVKDAPAAPLPAKEAPAAKPEAAKPEAAKPEAAKPEAAKPEAAKPEAAKPEAAKPEAAKPEAAKPEAAKPEALPAKAAPAAKELPKPEAAKDAPAAPLPAKEDAAAPLPAKELPKPAPAAPLAALAAGATTPAGRRRLLVAAVSAALTPEATRALMPYLHPVKVLNGAAPPAPGARAPLTVCSSQTVSWTEQFSGAPVEACGELYNALQTVKLTPTGGAGAPAPVERNVSLPVLVSGCSLKPSVKLLAARVQATRSYTWSVNARASDKGLAVAQSDATPVVARYAVAYNRTEVLSNYTIEPAIVLLNPFAKAVPVFGVYATVKIPGKEDITARLRCKGAGANGALVLPAAPAGAAPQPVACIGTVPLPAGAAGELTVTAETRDGATTSAPASFNAAGPALEVTASDKLRCVTIDGGFSSASPGGGPAPLVPTSTSPAAPRPKQVLCEPRRFVFSATFGPFTAANSECGTFVVSRRAGLPRWEKGRGRPPRPVRQRACRRPRPANAPTASPGIFLTPSRLPLLPPLTGPLHGVHRRRQEGLGGDHAHHRAQLPGQPLSARPLARARGGGAAPDLALRAARGRPAPRGFVPCDAVWGRLGPLSPGAPAPGA
jgi:hypothetical protein